MKKLLAWALALMLALPVFTLAETEDSGMDTIATDGMLDREMLRGRFSEEEELTWDTVSELLPEVVANGAFVSLEELGLKIWIPDDLVMITDAVDGVVCAFYDEELTYGFTVILETLPEDVDTRDLDALAAYFDFYRADAGSAIAHLYNGIPCVEYTLADCAQGCITFSLDNGMVVTFVYEPSFEQDSVEDVDETTMFRLALALMSIQPMDD